MSLNSLASTSALQVSNGLGNTNGLSGLNSRNGLQNGLGSDSTDTLNKLVTLLMAVTMMNMMGNTLSNSLGNGGMGGFGGAGGQTGSGLSGFGESGIGNTGTQANSDTSNTYNSAYNPSSNQNLTDSKGLGQTSDQSPLDKLMKLFQEVLSELFGDSQDGQTGQGNSKSPFGNAQPDQTQMDAYNQGLKDGLAMVLNGLSGNGAQGGSGATVGLGGSGATRGLGGQTPSTPSDFQQIGTSIGQGVGQKAGLQALNDIGTEHDSDTRYFVNKEDRGIAKEIGKFMDQYPGTFGSPEYQKDDWKSAKTDDKSWAEALSNPDDDGMTKASMDKFLAAKGMIKSAMAGDTGNTNLQTRGTGGSSLGIDAQITADTINSMAVHNLSAA